jgi:hypothetical protein
MRTLSSCRTHRDSVRPPVQEIAMMGSGREGWYEDPAKHHEWRWFSDGTPTALVKVGTTTAQDPIDAIDAAQLTSMTLAQGPAVGGTPHVVDDKPPHFELVNFGVGPVKVINTNADRSDDSKVWTRSPGVIELVLILLPWPVGFLICAEAGAPVIAYLGIAVCPLLIAIAGRGRRRREAARLPS